MFQTTDNEALSTQTTENKKNQDVSSGTAGANSSGVGESIENLSTAAKSTKSKKPKLTKPKKSNVVKVQNFAKANSFEIDFLTPGAKEAFIHLRKAFTKALILRHFDPEYYIRIETNVLGYAIGRVLSQIISDHLDQLFSNHVTQKNLNPIFSKSKIGQWHSIAFFF